MALFGSAFKRGAGNSVWIEYPNGPAFSGRFKQRMAGMEIATNNALGNMADEVVAVARDLVAKDTHKTKDSIRKERRGRDWVVVADRKGDRPEVPIYLEIGTHKMAARPFMVPALNLVVASGGMARAVRLQGGLLGQTPGRKG